MWHVNDLGGLLNDGEVPRVFYPSADGMTQQLSLFDQADHGYEIKEAGPSEFD